MSMVTGELHPVSTATTDVERLAAVTAPVRDPLWLLSRQHQTRGFLADDGGSPVSVAAATTTAALVVDGRPVSTPLEPDLEAEPPTPRDQLDTATRVRLATELFRRVRDAGVPAATLGSLRAGLATDHPLRPVLAGSGMATVAAALPDPVSLYAAWAAAVGLTGTTGKLPPLPGAGRSRSKIEVAARAWVAWMTPRLGPATADAGAGPGAPKHWDALRLAYSFDGTADLGSATLTYRCEDYDGRGVEWFTFDRAPGAASLPQPAPVVVRPSPVTYPGMPERGFWTIEDGTVNLDVLAGQDPTRQLLVTYAHGFGNDWFVVPLELEPGVSLVTALTVTDSFGTVTEVGSAAALDGPTARFRLWEQTPVGAAADVALGSRLFLPTATRLQESTPTEDVLLVRDEMANLAWLVELTTTDEDGGQVDRYRRWLTLRTEGDPTFHPATQGQARYYRLGTGIPDYWSPLVSDGDDLRLAALPPGAVDVDQIGVMGTLLEHAPGTRVGDEQVPRVGTRVRRVNRVLTTATGRRAWRARQRTPGTGEASSGLRFDTLGAPASPPNLLRNPALLLAQRTARVEALTASGRKPSLARDWQLVNTRGGHTEALVEPATRSEGGGWQLHVVTTKARSGVAQQFASKAQAPKSAEARAWVYVIRGQVALSAGPGGSMKAGAVSQHTGRWEHLTTANSRSPVTQLVLLAQGGPAEFIVDTASVRH
jgi:hypothetical protein